NVSEDELMFVKALCESFGIAVNISENLFSAYSAIGGCSPAFAYMFIDSLARGAVKNGMPKDIALEVAAGAVLGSAKMILESNEHPWALVDQVCSPGGTTIEGVTSLKNDGFESAVMNAVQAAIDKDKRL
ncbi:MAG: pyrroline-5-carboxylate reductase, partial [Clostridia bacterium]|nr:pyrroline-5-carboxylate reductase [Clostridia bacterium]